MKQLKYIDDPLTYNQYKLGYDSNGSQQELSGLKFWKLESFSADGLFAKGVDIERLWYNLLDTDGGLSLANSYRLIAYLWSANYREEDIGPVYFSDESNLKTKLQNACSCYFTEVESETNGNLCNNWNITPVTSLESSNLSITLNLKYNVDSKGIEQPLAGFSDNTFSWNDRYLNSLGMLALILNYLTEDLLIPDEDIVTFIEDIATSDGGYEETKTVTLSDAMILILSSVLIDLENEENVDISVFNNGTIIQ